MPDATGTLDLIDGAIRDWETSPDAMRWGPDRQTKRGREVAAVWIDEPLNHDAFYEQWRQMTAPLAAIFDNLSAAFQAMATALQPFLEEETAHGEDAERRPSWHKRRCARCNPACAITPSCPGGREYRRRLKARARRGR